MQVGDTFEDFVVTFDPVDATNQNVTWSSNNSEVVSVDLNGKVTAYILSKIDGTRVVRDITDDGFVLFDRVGGVNTQILPGTKFVFDTDNGLVEGVVGVPSHGRGMRLSVSAGSRLRA